MIKHKKLIICILLSYALFIVGIFNVRAYSLTDLTDITPIDITWGSDASGAPLIQSDSAFTANGRNINFVVNEPNADFIVIQGYSTLLHKNNTTEVVDRYSSVRLVTYDNVTYLCENHFDNGYVICPNPKKQTKYINILLGVSTGGDLGFYQWNYGLMSPMYYANKPKENNNTTITNNTTDINNKISDSSIDTNNTSSSTSSWGNKNASNGTITNLLTLPISLLQAIVNGIQSSCSSFSLGSLFGTNIILPCINIGSLIGSGLWSTIDILFSGFMILAIAKKLIKIFNDFTNLKTNQVDELYGGGK